MPQSRSAVPVAWRERSHIAWRGRGEARRQRKGQLPTWGAATTDSSAAEAPQSAENRRPSDQAHRAPICLSTPYAFFYVSSERIPRLQRHTSVRLCAQQPCAPHKPRRERCIPRPDQWPPSGSPHHSRRTGTNPPYHTARKPPRNTAQAPHMPRPHGLTAILAAHRPSSSLAVQRDNQCVTSTRHDASGTKRHLIAHERHIICRNAAQA